MRINWGTSTDKARRTSIALLIVLAGAACAVAAAEEYHLYKPAMVQQQSIPLPGEGVLTKTITIQKGDTLKKLSRRYSGRSSFFPQILLFNGIKDPDLILAGAQLQVPLTKQEAQAAKGGTEKKRRHAVRKGAPKHETHSSAERHYYGKGAASLFRRGVRAFDAGQYRRAIEIFDRYLATYPDSPHAPDADAVPRRKLREACRRIIAFQVQSNLC